jgi:FlaA1/EpsC-like NDP-sugar epimerase
VEAVIRTFQVNTIYHAAAYKHVPLVEHNPIEGVQNNLFGTWRTAEAALATGVETFVLISTDKAVRPTNVMGATKRMAELLLQAKAQQSSTTRFCMVRFGNVLGSSGSVVPLFRQQIHAGGPVTVTHPEITRYFMMIPEAAQLVLQAGSMGVGGEIFVLDMGESVKIADLAKRMIKLSGLEVRDGEDHEGDIEIVYTGLRPGEKLYEELLIGGDVSGTDHPRIMRVMENLLPWDQFQEILQSIEKACAQFDSEKVRQMLQSSVCGYKPQCDIVDPVWLQISNDEKLKEMVEASAKVMEIHTQKNN